MLDATIIYLVLGAVAGIIAGLFGVGGGLVIVPVLVIIFQTQSFDNSIIMQLALGTSLATIMFTAISAVIAHHRRGAMRWALVFSLAPGMLLGSFAGAFLADEIGSDQLKHLFAVFEFIIGLYMIIGAPRIQTAMQVIIRKFEFFVVGSGIGLMSSLLGIGGGTMTVPYLSWRGVNMHKAVAISSACGMPIALSGALAFLLAGLGNSSLPTLATGYIYWPGLVGIVSASLLTAPLGASIAHNLPLGKLKRLFGFLLLTLAIVMLFIK